ncbi:hypothetical protein HY003_00235 [Candidatus Saccharibacteria bacterium]|nr:hypothetical protein [Candidatus Saccharibacteria bacterium]MBI3337719.1 hypothetical protein [Candidatus Saccharibacteria bacterium]
MKKSNNNKKWFIKVRWSYLPNTWQGWLTYIPYLAYLVAVMIYLYSSSYGFWTSVFILVPNYVVAALIITWLASKTS